VNSYYRVLAIFEHKIPDRIPTFELVIHPLIISKLNGRSDLLDFVEKMKLDGVTIFQNIELKEISNNILIDEWGIKRINSIEKNKIAIEGPIKKRSDLKNIIIPNLNVSGKFNDLSVAVKRFKKRKFIVFKINDVISIPRDLLGYENFLINLYDDQKLILELVDLSYYYNLELASKVRQIGADAVVLGDDFADNRGLLFSPSLYKKLFYPHFCKLIKSLKELGLFVIKHSDGNINEILDLLIQSNIDCLNPIDPLAGMDIAKLKIQYGRKIVLMGNVNCATTLVNGNKNEIIKEVLNIIKNASNGGGLIMSSSNSIHSGVDPYNYLLMIKTIRKYGRY